jgi:hypothetical protein
VAVWVFVGTGGIGRASWDWSTRLQVGRMCKYQQQGGQPMESTLPVHRDTPTDEFRALDDMAKRDWRQNWIGIIDWQAGTNRQKTVEDRHRMVSQYRLCVDVPDVVWVQWDTALNLWLYAWHVWRFYAVAEMQEYATLEMALRIKPAHDKKRKAPMLRE